MPMYEYACRSCGVIAVVNRAMKDRDLAPKCPEGCGVYMVRHFSVAAVMVK